MKSLENQYKNIKNDYGDKISIHLRNKLQKIMNVAKEMHRLQFLKSSQQTQSQDRLLGSVKNQLIKIRREIEGQLKLHLTDYEAYLWKLQKIQHLDRPNMIENFKLIQVNPPPLTYELVNKNFNLPILGYKTKDLIKVSAEILMENKFCNENFNNNLITKLITQFSYNYNILPYHTFTHAFSVFMMMFQCKNTCEKLSKMFSQFQFFVTFIAALGHDLNHKGTNSFYQIKKKSELALTYNNQSVLENMHISQFYRICKDNPDIDIISKIKSSAQRENAKRLFNRLILATDALGHNKNLKKFQQVINSKKQANELQSNQKQIILQNLFHACDIGNPCLEYDVYKNWSILISLEFNQQAQIEKSESLEVSTNMQFIDMHTHYRRQIGFIDFLVLPTWKQVSNIFPQLQIVKDKIEQNKGNLQKMIQQAN